MPAAVITRARAILEALEHDELTRGGRPSISGTPSEPQRQLGLFQMASADPAAEKLAQRLRATDTDNLTPLQALSLLADLKKELGGKGPRGSRIGRSRAFQVLRPSRVRRPLAVAQGFSPVSPARRRLLTACARARHHHRRHPGFARTTSIRGSAPTRTRRGRTSCCSTIFSNGTSKPASPLGSLRPGTRPTIRPIGFDLREGVRFHDGHELTSEDVVYTFTSMLDPVFASPYRGAFRDLASVVAIDRYTVDFVLNQPSGSFLPNLVFKIVPAGAGRELREHPVGTGPYEFVSYAVDDQLEVRAFREYFDGLPRNLGIIMKVVPDDIMRGLELRKATSDLIVNDLVPDMVYQLEKEGLSLTKSPGVDYQYVGFNLRDSVLKDVRVRHAIGHAIDRQAIVDHLRRGLATVADSMLPPSNWAHRAERARA